MLWICYVTVTFSREFLFLLIFLSSPITLELEHQQSKMLTFKYAMKKLVIFLLKVYVFIKHVISLLDKR